MATVTSSVEVIRGALANAHLLDAKVQVLRQRFPRSIIDRYCIFRKVVPMPCPSTPTWV